MGRGRKPVREAGCLLLVFFVLLVFSQPPVVGQKYVTVEGSVREHSTGIPIPDAKILVFGRSLWGFGKLYYVEAYSNGSFLLKLWAGFTYTIYAYYDDPLTPGFDYVPSEKNIQTPSSGKMNMTFELWDGASMFLEGEALFAETTEPAQSFYYVLDPDSGRVIQLGEYVLYYGEDTSSQSYFLGLSPKHIIVPAGTPFTVKVDSLIKVGRETLKRSFLIDRPGHFVLGKGEAVHVDMREYCLPLSLSTVGSEASEIGLTLDEREVEGFYLAVERQRLALITSLTLEAENLLGQGSYEASFTSLREAYTEISNLRDWLNSMYTEALRSVFLLIPFLAFTATAISYLFFEEKLHKVFGASGFYAAFLPALYLLYPGSRLVGASLFLVASLISLPLVLGLSTFLPRLLKGREFRGRVPLRNMVVPVFSIAKRSLRRRKLRFALTLTSVMVLVSSFIALTSFTTGFGLTFGQVSSQPGPSKGILMRAAIPLRITNVVHLENEEIYLAPYSFFPLDNSSIQWFEARTETRLVAPKYENLPCRLYRGETVGYFGRMEKFDGIIRMESIPIPIYGVIGVSPSAEAEILRLNETIIEGGYLSDGDENGVLISRELKEKLNATVGETLTFRTSGKTLELEIIGIFDDKRFEDLRDLDGDSLLPKKITAQVISSDSVYKTYIEKLTPCLPNEILITTSRTALEINGIELSRLNILLEDEDLKEYAKMMAVNKGFRVWASTEEGIYLAELASYFEGKGLPITIPWLIVVVNVVVTMLNSLHERRREIHIYSSIGMSPSHISGIFLAEAAVIGVLGGGIGYLIGLAWYKGMSLLATALQVRQKLSALWTLAAIAVSLAAVLVGGLTALKGSVVITPSLRRRWSAEREIPASMEPLELTLPVRVAEAEVEEFVEYVMNVLRSHVDGLNFVVRQIREAAEETEGVSIRRIEFIYRSAVIKLSGGGSYTRNKLILRKERDSEFYTVKLLTEGDAKGILRVGSLIRKTIMEWSIERGKLEEDRLTSTGRDGGLL